MSGTDCPGTTQNLTLDVIQLMPDHLHCILHLNTIPSTDNSKVEYKSLSRVIQALKAASSREMGELGELHTGKVWQKGFHERIIRNEGELEKFRKYAVENPLRFQFSRSRE